MGMMDLPVLRESPADVILWLPSCDCHSCGCRPTAHPMASLHWTRYSAAIGQFCCFLRLNCPIFAGFFFLKWSFGQLREHLYPYCPRIEKILDNRTENPPELSNLGKSASFQSIFWITRAIFSQYCPIAGRTAPGMEDTERMWRKMRKKLRRTSLTLPPICARIIN